LLRQVNPLPALAADFDCLTNRNSLMRRISTRRECRGGVWALAGNLNSGGGDGTLQSSRHEIKILSIGQVERGRQSKMSSASRCGAGRLRSKPICGKHEQSDS
jgi:hypothetical protein